MTPKEYAAEIVAFEAAMGTKNPHVSTYINKGSKSAPLRACAYSNWPTGNFEFEVEADTFSDLLAGLKSKWIVHSAAYRAGMIRKMALKIIDITADVGHCTDAALRGTYEFSEQDVTTFGKDACDHANAIADKGPFEIVTLGGANGAPDEIPQGATVN